MTGQGTHIVGKYLNGNTSDEAGAGLKLHGRCLTERDNSFKGWDEKGRVSEDFSSPTDHSNHVSKTTKCACQKLGTNPTFTVQNQQWNTFICCLIVGLLFFGSRGWGWGMFCSGLIIPQILE